MGGPTKGMRIDRAAPGARLAVQSVGAQQLVAIRVKSEGAVFGLDTNGTPMQAVPSTLAWVPFGGPGNATLSSIDAASDGTLCGTAGGGAYLFSEQSWKELPAPPASGGSQATWGLVSTGSSTNVCALDSNGLAYRFASATNTWAPIAPDGLTSALAALCNTSDGSLWALDKNGGVFYLGAAGGPWTDTKAPEGITALGAGASGWAWAIGNSGAVFQFDGVDQPWQAMPSPLNDTLTSISCGDDTTIFATAGSTGNLYQFDEDEQAWAPVQGASAPIFKVAVGDAMDVFGLDGGGALYQYAVGSLTWRPYPLPSGMNPSGYLDIDGIIDSPYKLALIDSAGVVYVMTDSQFYSDSSAKFDAVRVSSNITLASSQGRLYTSSTAPLDFGPVQLDANDPLVGMAIGIPYQAAGIYYAGQSGSVYQWTGTSWDVLSTTPQMKALSAAPDGSLWALDVQGNGYVYLGSTGGSLAWYQVGVQLCDISAGSVSEVWALGTPQLNPICLVSGSNPFGEGGPLSQGDGHGLRWDTENVFDETQSTHLWIVNRGARLAALQGSIGQQISALVKPGQGRLGNDGIFHDNLCQGLYDADFVEPYNTPTFQGQPSYAGHFYDPDTGLNWIGNTINTALTYGTDCFNQAVNQYAQGHYDQAGYNLGLSLHFLTDMTQPMHACNFTYLSSHPRWGYHTAFEQYALEAQAWTRVPTAYTASTLGTAPGPYLIAAAKNSKSKYTDDLHLTYASRLYIKWTSGWEGSADDVLPGALSDAVNFVSQYLVAWMQAASAASDSSRGESPKAS